MRSCGVLCVCSMRSVTSALCPRMHSIFFGRGALGRGGRVGGLLPWPWQLSDFLFSFFFFFLLTVTTEDLELRLSCKSVMRRRS